MPDSLPTLAQIIADLQVLGTQQVGTDQILQGINALSFAANTTLANTLGQLSDQITKMDADISLRLGSQDANLFSLQQRISAMSDDISTQIAAETTTLKNDIATLQTGLTGLEAQAAQAVADATARGTVDAQTLADLTALHQQVSSMSASIPSAAPAAPPADPAQPAPADPSQPAPSDPAPAPAPTPDPTPAPADPSAPPATDPSAPAPAPTDPNAPAAPTTADPSAPPADPAPASPTT